MLIYKILKAILIPIVITISVAVALVFTQRPKAMQAEGGLDFSNQIAQDISDPAPLHSAQMRDGYGLKYRDYPSDVEGAPLLVMVHGSGWHGLQFDSLAKALQAKAHVIVPDLRGHGTAPGRRGDVGYIGQLEDDLADLIAVTRKPDQSLVMAGHSSGGGLVVRFAGGAQGRMLDGAILLAPFLKHNAPMTRANSGGWAHTLARRIIGLSILNTFRITALNHLPIIQFNMPAAVLEGTLGETATTQYSYRLNTSFAPRSDYLKDVAALPKFLLIAGSEDEAFDATLFAPTMVEVTDKGRYEVLSGANHLDVVNDPRALAKMESFLNEF